MHLSNWKVARIQHLISLVINTYVTQPPRQKYAIQSTEQETLTHYQTLLYSMSNPPESWLRKASSWPRGPLSSWDRGSDSSQNPSRGAQAEDDYVYFIVLIGQFNWYPYLLRCEGCAAAAELGLVVVGGDAPALRPTVAVKLWKEFSDIQSIYMITTVSTLVIIIFL